MYQQASLIKITTKDYRRETQKSNWTHKALMYKIKSFTHLDTIILMPAVILLIIGCFGILNAKSLINSLFSLDVIDTATISIFVLIAATSGSQTPILSSGPRYADYSDPYPQAIILTAIVIGFATQALLCTIALRLSRSTPLLRYEDLEK